MPKPKSVPTKLLIGFSDDQLRSVDRWRAKQTGVPNRSEAIRALVDVGLEASRTAAESDAAVPKPLRSAFLDAVFAVRNSEKVDRLVKMLEAGDVDGALRAVGVDPSQFRPFDRTFEAAANEALAAQKRATKKKVRA